MPGWQRASSQVTEPSDGCDRLSERLKPMGFLADRKRRRGHPREREANRSQPSRRQIDTPQMALPDTTRQLDESLLRLTTNELSEGTDDWFTTDSSWPGTRRWFEPWPGAQSAAPWLPPATAGSEPCEEPRCAR